MHQATRPTAVYRIDALIAEGFSARTIRYYIDRGILPHAHGRGRSAYYDDAHVAILRRIKRARDDRRTLEDIREDCHQRYKHAFKGTK